MKLKAMNALLRLRWYLENHEHLPPEGILTPLLEHQQLGHRLAMNQIIAEDLIAPGLREDSPYRERFNLAHEDVVVMARAAGKPHTNYTFTKSWSNYVRATFVPKRFHCFPGLGGAEDRVYIYILEHKTLAGREDIPDDDAKARPLEVCFFKPIQDSPPG